MSVSRRILQHSRAFFVFCILTVISSILVAQENTQQQKNVPDAPSAQAKAASASTSPNTTAAQTDYSKSKSILSVVGPYKETVVPPPNLGNAPRVDQVMRDGKVMLSLNDAVAMALENNLDIAISRYNLNIADTDLLRALGGAQNRGVSTGVVQGTPGGTGTSLSSGSTGTGVGGTTSGAGGAATGAGGIVAATTGVGPAVESFDPAITSTLQIEHARSLVTNPAIYGGLTSLDNNVTTADFAYTQGWATGTAMNLSWNNSRSMSNLPAGFTTFNPALNSSFRLTLRQHLTQGWGLSTNRRFIITAKNNRRISNAAFRQQVISTVVQIQDIYWDLVNAYENLKVQEEAVRFADRTLSDNKKQVEIGTLAPIEIVHAQSQLATAQQQLIAAQTNLEYQQLLMKNAVTRNMSDPTLAAAPVIPTDTMQLDTTGIAPIQDLVNEALKRRPEIDQSRIDLENRAITKKAARQGMLPTVDLVGFYGGSGLAMDYGTAATNMVNSTAPDKGAFLSLTVPIRNRVAQADQVRSQLEYRQAEMRFQQQQNNIMIDVRFAQYALQQARAQVDAATKARDYALQSLEAEQKKYALGASTSYLVLQLENQYVQAQSSLVTAMNTYEKSRVDLDRATGFTLDRMGIMLPEAVSGVITHTPTVPNITPRVDIQPTQMQQQQAAPQQPAPQQQEPPQKK